MAIFPGAVATDSNLFIAVNGIQTTLAASILSTDTTIQLTSVTGFPTTGYVTIDNSEVVLYTGISGSNLTGCTRGADGTTAAPHNLGVTVGATIVAAHHNLLKDEIKAIETALGANLVNVFPATPTTGTGNVVLQTSPTINTPTLTAPALGTPASGVLTNCTGLPISAGTTGTLPDNRTTATPNATASTIVERDSNANTKVNTVVENFTTTVTAAGTTTLTAASSPIQQFTGTTTQTVKLPDCTTLSTGYQITVLNRSTGVVTVQNNGGTTQQSMAANTQTTFTCTNTGSANGTWDVSTSSGAGSSTAYREDYVVGTALNNYTGSSTVFNLVNAYVVAGQSLVVTLDGDVQTIGASVDYLETNSTTVTFNNTLVTGQKVSFIFQVPVSAGGTVNAGTTGQVAYYASNGSVVSGLSSPSVTQLQYFLNLLNYRRPVLQYSSSTVVLTETGLDGTSGDAVVLFPDGQLRTETSSTRYGMTITQNAVFTNATLGSNQGGLRTGSATNNTWYACYAVKVTTFSANWVLVADTVLPLQSNFSTLNTNFGTNSWTYIGMIRYGDNSGHNNVILNFVQSGSWTSFQNVGAGGDLLGTTLATGSSITSLTYTRTSGTGTTNIPNHLTIGQYNGYAQNTSGSTGEVEVTNSAANTIYYESAVVTGNEHVGSINTCLANGIALNANFSSSSMAITIGGFCDGVLGVGSNPML